MNQHALKYLLTGFSSYLIWGFLPVFLKLIETYDGYTIVLHRTVTAALVLSIVMIFLLTNFT